MSSIRNAVIAACALAVAPLLAQSPLREGNWEIRAQMEIPGMPTKMPEMQLTQCVTAEQSKNPTTLLSPSGNPGDPSCKVTDYKADGNTITWKMSCAAPQTMTGDGRMVVSGDTYTGTLNMTTAQGAMAIKSTGKRTGDCKK
jgi:hypothetical protein